MIINSFFSSTDIADVSFFVHEGTPLDEEAQKRGTSVYFADRRIDMLPKPLTEDICSLREKVDRCAFSVMYEVDRNANILNTRFTRSVVRSVHSFSYGEAQALIDSAEQSELANGLRELMRISMIMRRRRTDKGALTLASTEIRFKKDENHQPVDIEAYQHLDANEMVEEWMLAANISVAQFIFQHFPNYACLRRHPAPDPRNFDSLRAVLRRKGFDLDISSSLALGRSLDRAVDPNDPMFNTLARLLTTRCMAQALYFSSGTLGQEEFSHYGLATPIYTHFTSPIRRYAGIPPPLHRTHVCISSSPCRTTTDLVVHRLLAAAINAETSSLIYNKSSMQKICNGLFFPLSLF